MGRVGSSTTYKKDRFLVTYICGLMYGHYSSINLIDVSSANGQFHSIVSFHLNIVT